MTDRYDEIRKRAWAAAPGPWVWHWREDDDVWPGSIIGGVDTGRAYAVAMCPRYGKESFAQDAEFIAHAREDVPWLIAEVDALRQNIHELKARLERYEPAPEDRRAMLKEHPIG